MRRQRLLQRLGGSRVYGTPFWGVLFQGWLGMVGRELGEREDEAKPKAFFQFFMRVYPETEQGREEYRPGWEL